MKKKTYVFEGMTKGRLIVQVDGKPAHVNFEGGSIFPSYLPAKFETTSAKLQEAIEKDKRFGATITLRREDESEHPVGENILYISDRKDFSRKEEYRGAPVPPEVLKFVEKFGDKLDVLEKLLAIAEANPEALQKTPKGKGKGAETPIIPAGSEGTTPPDGGEGNTPTGAGIIEVPNVTTGQAAKDYLNKEHGVPLSQLPNKEAIRAVAAEKGVAFPNMA